MKSRADRTAIKITTNVPFRIRSHISKNFSRQAEDSVTVGKHEVWRVMFGVTLLLQNDLQDWARTREGVGYYYWR